jgi:hypothetical protein
MKPSLLTAAQQKTSTKSEGDARDPSLYEEHVVVGVTENKARRDETYRGDDAPVRDDDNVEIEIDDDVNGNGGNQGPEDGYDYHDASKKIGKKERSQFKYRASKKLVDFDVVTSSLTSLYVIVVVLTVFVILLLCRMMHCRVYRRFRFK